VLGSGIVVGPISVPTGGQPSIRTQVLDQADYAIGYFVAVCQTDPRKSIPIKLYGQFQGGSSPDADFTTCVGNCLQPDAQQTTVNAIDATSFATCELINAGQGAGGNYTGVQLKSFFPGGGEETWLLSAIPNMLSSVPF
jgi:hypothetical protein